MQLDKADKYELLQPVYALSFVNETFEKSPEMRNEYYHHYKIVNVKDTQKQIKGLELVFIELPKFVPQNRAEKKLHELWLRFLTEINEGPEDIPPELLENSDIREAVEYLDFSIYTSEQRFAYDKIRDAIMTGRSFMSDSERKGRKEERKKIALAALKEGIPLEMVSKMTGLSIDELLKLNK
jgi:predicted transposase/invertase (TIGR01784 family)